MGIYDRKQVEEEIINIKANLEKTSRVVVQELNENNSFDSLLKLKFDKIGFDPITGDRCNFIEALNQSYSDLVVLRALLILMDKYPGTEFEINLGTKSGVDIESVDGSICAECFAVVSVDNNRKLKIDIEKMERLQPNAQKYIFCYSHNDDESDINLKRQLYPEVEIIRITASEL